MKRALIRWYNAHIVAAWYRSWAIWVAVFAALLPYTVDVLQYALDNWTTAGSYLNLQPSTKEALRVFLLVVVLPAARAWQQQKMQQAAQKQLAQKATGG